MQQNVRMECLWNKTESWKWRKNTRMIDVSFSILDFIFRFLVHTTFGGSQKYRIVVEMFHAYISRAIVCIIVNGTHWNFVLVQGRNIYASNVLCLNKSINVAERDKANLRPSIPFAWRLRLQSKSSLRPWSFFRWCWKQKVISIPIHEYIRALSLSLFPSFYFVVYSLNWDSRYSTSQKEKPIFLITNLPSLLSGLWSANGVEALGSFV